jgi:hypothetical protein
MRSLSDIRTDIERLTNERAEVMRRLSEGHDPVLVAEHQAMEEQIAQLWEEHRIARARVRFGERDQIIQRARHEERLERAA